MGGGGCVYITCVMSLMILLICFRCQFGPSNVTVIGDNVRFFFEFVILKLQLKVSKSGQIPLSIIVDMPYDPASIGLMFFSFEFIK